MDPILELDDSLSLSLDCIVEDRHGERRSSLRTYQSSRASELKKFKLILSTVLQKSQDQQWVAFDHEYHIQQAGIGFNTLRMACKRNAILYAVVVYDRHMYIIHWQGHAATARMKVNYTGTFEPVKDFFNHVPIGYLEKQSQLTEKKIITFLQDLQKGCDSEKNSLSSMLEKIGLASFKRRGRLIEKSGMMISAANKLLEDSQSDIVQLCERVTGLSHEYTWAALSFDIEAQLYECFKVLDCGSGDVEEARNAVRTTNLCFVVLHFPMGERRRRFKNVLIVYMKPESNDIEKRLKLVATMIQQRIHGIHAEIFISNIEDLTPSRILKKLRQFTHTDEIMLRVVHVSSNSSRRDPPVIVYVDQEHSTFELKEELEAIFDIPIESQKVWFVRTSKEHEERTQSAEMRMSVTGRALKNRRFGVVVTESVVLDDDDKYLLTDYHLSTGVRLFVQNLDDGAESVENVNVNVAHVRRSELDMCLQNLEGMITKEKLMNGFGAILTCLSVQIDFETLIFVDDDLVGRGRTASVYRAFWIVAEVAVKKWNYGRLTDTIRDSFLKETNTLRRLNHPNIVRFVGACKEPLVLVTEWVPRGSLHDVLVNYSIHITYDDMLRMALEIALGMKYLHDQNIIHRDLKSHNLLIDENWTCKVTDFGIARELSEDSKAFTNAGTSGWTAPEVFEAVKEYEIGGYDKQVDIFSYGVVLWEIITRAERNPLTGLSEEKLKDRILHGPMPPFPENADPAYIRVVNECWQYNPEDRPSFDEIILWLQEIISSGSE